MIETFAASSGKVGSECLDLNHTGNSISLVSLFESEARSPTWPQSLANFAIGTLELFRLRSDHTFVIPAEAKRRAGTQRPQKSHLGPGYFVRAKFRDDNRTFRSEPEVR